MTTLLRNSALALSCALPLFVFEMGVTPCHADVWAAQFFASSVSLIDEESGDVSLFIPNFSAGLAGPSGIAFNGDGNVYLSSQLSGEIMYFDATTATPTPSPLAGARDGVFSFLGEASAPGRIAFGPDGNLYVADSIAGGENIRIIDSSSGELLGNAIADDTLANPGQVIGFTFTPDGTLLAGKSSPIFQGSIFSIDGAGQATEIVAPGAAGLQSVSSMLVGPNDELFVVDLFGNQIVRFDDVNGLNPQQFAIIPPEIPDPLPMGAGIPSNSPSDIRFDANGDLLVSVLGLTNPAFGGDDRGALLRYDLEGNLLDTIVTGLSPVGAIALPPAGGSLEGDYNNNGQVEQADLDLVLLNWGDDAAGLPAEWESNRPTTGIVDQAELDDVLLNWGATAAGANGAAVPEPASLALLLILAAGGCVLFRRQRPHA